MPRCGPHGSGATLTALPAIPRALSLLLGAILVPLAAACDGSGRVPVPDETCAGIPRLETAEAFVLHYDRALGGGQPALLRSLIAPEGLVADALSGRPVRLEDVAGGIERQREREGPGSYRSSELTSQALPGGQLLVRSRVRQEPEGTTARRTLILRPNGACGLEATAELWREEQP